MNLNQFMAKQDQICGSATLAKVIKEYADKRLPDLHYKGRGVHIGQGLLIKIRRCGRDIGSWFLFVDDENKALVGEVRSSRLSFDFREKSHNKMDYAKLELPLSDIENEEKVRAFVSNLDIVQRAQYDMEVAADTIDLATGKYTVFVQ